jgi:hypothetical protein
MLSAFWMKWLPGGGRNGENWNEFLNDRPQQFIKVRIKNPSEARPGGILCYEDGWFSKRTWKRTKASTFGHVEIVGTDGAYYHYLRSESWGGSRGQDISNSWFDKNDGNVDFMWFVYYPRFRG